MVRDDLNTMAGAQTRTECYSLGPDWSSSPVHDKTSMCKTRCKRRLYPLCGYTTCWNLNLYNSYINPITPVDSYLNPLDQCISKKRGVWVILLLPCFIEILVLYANSVDQDQTPRSVGLHCLLMSPLLDARLKWVKERLQNCAIILVFC